MAEENQQDAPLERSAGYSDQGNSAGGTKENTSGANDKGTGSDNSKGGHDSKTGSGAGNESKNDGKGKTNSNTKDDLYSVLGFDDDVDRKSITPEQIKKKFREACRKNHPDFVRSNNKGLKDEDYKKLEAEAQEKLKTINNANDILSDPDLRARYDRGQEYARSTGGSYDYSGASSGRSRSSTYDDSWRSQKHDAYGGKTPDEWWDDLLKTASERARKKVEDELKNAKAQKRAPDFSDLNISNMDFSGMDLRGVKFSSPEKSNLIYQVNFTGAQLDGADFSNSDVSFCKFDKIEYKNQPFKTKSLRHCSFEDAKMDEVEFLGDVSGNDFIKTSLNKATFKNSKFGDFNIFKDAKITGVDFTGCEFSINSFQEECDLTNTNLSNTKGFSTFVMKNPDDNGKKKEFLEAMSGVNFGGAKVDDALDKLNLKGADLRGVIIKDKWSKYDKERIFRDSILDDAMISEGALFDAALKNAKSCKDMKVFDKDGKEVTPKYEKKIKNHKQKSWVSRIGKSDTAEIVAGTALIAGGILALTSEEKKRAADGEPAAEKNWTDKLLSWQGAAIIAGGALAAYGAYKKWGGKGR